MNLLFKNLLPVLQILFLSLLLAFGLTAFADSAHAKGNPKYAALVMDADTGMILFERYADKKLHPASLTKVMTLIMVFDALEQRKLSLYQRIPVSSHAASMVPSKLGLSPGSTIRVQDAIYALVTKSANDIAVTLAEKIGGSERNFAAMMTQKAKEIGMRNTTFKNASGLHHPYQVSTARDMALMGRYVIARYPQYYTFFSKEKFTYAGKTYRNHNKLLGKYKGMDGMKTGYIQASGFNLIASAVQDNRRLIGVVFGGRSSKTRNAHMEKILDQSFDRIRNMAVANITPPVPDRKPSQNVAFASLNDVTPSSGNAAMDSVLQEASNMKWSLLNPSLQKGLFSRLIGEGDFDPAVSTRIETGLIAIAAHRGESIPQSMAQAPASQKIASAIVPSRKVAATPNDFSNTTVNDTWGIQIGAFSSRAASDQALQTTLNKLPSHYASANPLIAPLKTAQGYIFRARLNGMSARDAQTACAAILEECLILAPHAY